MIKLYGDCYLISTVCHLSVAKRFVVVAFALCLLIQILLKPLLLNLEDS